MISKNEVENLNAVFEKILSSAVEEKDFEYKLPLDGKLSDSNKVYSGKLSVMFIDIRNSTKLPDKYTSAEIVKVYRAYARAVGKGDIFIDYATYKGLSDKSDGWVENGFVINGNNLQGYVASKYYLDIDSDIVMDDSNGDVETYTAESETNIINKCIKEQLQQIREESEKLGEQREWLRKKENEIVKRERNLNDKEDELNDEKLKSLEE